MPDLRTGARMRRNLIGAAMCMSAAIGLTVSGALAQDDSGPPADASVDGAAEVVRGDELTPETREAIDRGLAWLATRQQQDGSFGGGGSAYTSIAAIAFMSSGSLPHRGPYGEEVAKAVDAVLAMAQPSGLLCPPNSGGLMYHHGFATLLLGEVYGMTGDQRVKQPLQRAVRLIQKSQHPLGGWRYQPIPSDHDISVTICQVMGLRAARDAGIKVDKAVIDKAIEYVQKCQNDDGGFRYRLGQGSH
ncbi:MAG: prenyltransferase/squalene oxidase repeat-containing protein, partial [Planctomycetota bacterium]